MYWEYLEYIKRLWTEIKLNELAEFISWLRVNNPKIIHLQMEVAKRTETTVNAILTAISTDNLNGIRSKSRSAFIVHVSQSLMQLYTKLLD